jgi:hypothetical protein
MSRWLKVLLFGVWGLLLIPPSGALLGKWLEENIFPEREGVSAISNRLVAIGQQPWFRFALVFMTGIAIGVSLESLGGKSGERRAFEVRSLGYKFRSLSDSIQARIESSGWPDNVRDLRPAIMSAFVAARKFGLWAPGERVYELPDPSFLCEYFKCVGKLLEDGHLEEAAREALSWRPFLDRKKPS